MEHMKIPPNRRDRADEQSYERLLKSVIRLNVILLGIAMGIGLGLTLFIGTHISLAVTGERAGLYLNLLGVFLPGYSASPGGAWIGLVGGFVIGALSGSFVYYVYARSVGRGLAEMMTRDQAQGEIVEQATLRLSGHALGIALGGLMAVQLLLTTNWLVVRGTADQSPHAALLRNYFPGYSVDFVGSLIGAVEIFAFTYALSLVLSGVYNLVVARRQGRAAQ
jgi:hypothetical protein